MRDTGPGIPPEHLPHPFDRFRQGTRERRGSAGVGLTIVKGIVEAHGGRLAVESQVGQGTSFRIWIPAERGDCQRGAGVRRSSSPLFPSLSRSTVPSGAWMRSRMRRWTPMRSSASTLSPLRVSRRLPV